MIHDRQSAVAFLLGRIDYERTKVPYRSSNFKLGRMRSLMNRLGNPERGFPAVHIAGTKGKGSTAVMVASALIAAGYRTGVYTSPHLERLEERFVVDGEQCRSDEMVELLARIEPEVVAMDQNSGAGSCPPGPTYFEITTAVALLHFQRREVDCAVLEVGLGGRLDSTNVCHPVVSAITSISFDHTRQLGNTLGAIAGEKAGIIKPGVPVITGVEPPEPLEVISRIAADGGCRLLTLGRDFCFRAARPVVGESSLDVDVDSVEQLNCFDYLEIINGRRFELPGVTLPMLGRHQMANASVAIATLSQMRRDGWNLEDAAIRRGMAVAACPARIELVSKSPVVILDAAHNHASIAALLDVLRQRTVSGSRVLIFSTTVDKDVEAMLADLLPNFDHVVLTKYLNNPRAIEPEKLAVICAGQLANSERDLTGLRICPNPIAAWDFVQSIVSPNDLVCVTGSFFLAAEIRQHIDATHGEQ